MSTRPLLYALSAAGLLTGGLLLAQSSGPARAAPDYDPLLQAQGAACVSGDTSRRLIGYYQKLAAAKTEVRPFPTEAPTGTEAAFTPPPLWDNLGKLHFAISTKHPLTQRYFDQGLKLAYAFNHAEAARAFRQAQRLDPNCALCPVPLGRGAGAGAEHQCPDGRLRQSLLRTPNNGWALHGLSATYQRLGKQGAAATARTQFTQAWVGQQAPDLARL